MSKPRDEEYIQLSKLAPVVYEMTGVSRTVHTLKKWTSQGKLGQHGTKVKLKAAKRLGAWYSTRKWLQEFIDEVG